MDLRMEREPAEVSCSIVKALVPEVPDTRENHRHLVGIGSLDHFLVPDGTAVVAPASAAAITPSANGK
jgi:hypothetical protein